MPQHSPEYPMLRNYLELVSELPWKKSSMEMIDISKAKEVHIYDFYFLNSTMKITFIYFIVLNLVRLCIMPIYIGLKC